MAILAVWMLFARMLAAAPCALAHLVIAAIRWHTATVANVWTTSTAVAICNAGIIVVWIPVWALVVSMPIVRYAYWAQRNNFVEVRFLLYIHYFLLILQPKNHVAVCSCPTGYRGDPFTSCHRVDPGEYHTYVLLGCTECDSGTRIYFRVCY